MGFINNKLLDGLKSDSALCTYACVYWQNLVNDDAGFADQRGNDRFLMLELLTNY